MASKESFYSGKFRKRLLSNTYPIGEHSVIRSGSYFTGEQIKIGKNCFINSFCKFYSYNCESSSIEIEDNVVIAMNVLFCTHTHEIGDSKSRAVRTTLFQPIKINSGTWIGANVVVLPGVTIGEGCIIAAGAVVTENCEDNGLYGGIPTKLIRNLD